MENNLVITNSIEPKTYNGERIVTFKDIDLIHERPEGTAKRNFATNKKYFNLDEDYYKITLKELRTNFVPNSNGRGNPNAEVTLITESGYLLLVKSFTDELSWQVQKNI